MSDERMRIPEGDPDDPPMLPFRVAVNRKMQEKSYHTLEEAKAAYASSMMGSYIQIFRVREVVFENFKPSDVIPSVPNKRRKKR